MAADEAVLNNVHLKNPKIRPFYAYHTALVSDPNLVQRRTKR